ncbi:MAG: DUF3987 domain-containing protein [Candidatus Cloacimonetes bacterium]|nr:DUF3987 domain-containing protein [Candidatus Cloacimonadota bacterium]MDY0230736.1 DUF3987 domain-containing protein [Candidatus Cloacimonadaceae bacterium]
MHSNNQFLCPQNYDFTGQMQQNASPVLQNCSYQYATITTNTELQKKFLEYISINSKISDVFKTQNLIQTLERKYYELSAQSIINIIDATVKNYKFEHCIPRDMLDFAEEIGEATNTDVYSCIIATCTAIAIAMRGRYRVVLHKHWAEWLNIYSNIGKKSGEQKSALAEYLKKPFQDYRSCKRREAREKITSLNVKPDQLRRLKFASERKLFSNYMDKINKEGEDPGSMDMLLSELSNLNNKIDPYIPEQHAPPEIFWNVSTFLGLLKKLNQQGETIALLEAEASFIFSKYFKESVFTTLLNNAYVGEPYQYDTSTPKNKIELQTPSINILLFLQTEFMVEHFANEGLKKIGYLPRVLPIFASKYVATDLRLNIWGMDDTPIPSDLYSEKISKILDITYTQDQFREIYDIACEPEACRLIKKFHNQNQQDVLDNVYPHMEAFIKKLHGHAVRLAGAIHGWNHLHPHKHLLTAKEMRAGINLALIARDHANIAYNTELKNAKENAIKILRYLFRQDWSRSKPLISSTQLQQNVGFKKSQCLPALDFLEKHNIIRQHHEPGHAVLCILHKDLFHINLDMLITG